MATTGLFGSSPYELQQGRQAQLAAAADAYGKTNPNDPYGFDRARSGLYMAGNQLGGGIAGLLGAQDPEMKKAADLQAILQQFDMTTPQGLMQAGQAAQAKGYGNEAMQAFAKAREMQKAEADILYKGAQTKKEEAAARVEDAKVDIELLKAKQQAATGGMTNLPPEVQAILLNEARDPTFDAKGALATYMKTAGKADWSEPYKLDGVTVQKNSKTNEIRTAVARAPVVQAGLTDEGTALIAQAVIEGRLGPNQVNGRNQKIIAGILKQNPTANLLEMNVDALAASAAGKSLSVQSAKMGVAATEARKMLPLVANLASEMDKTEYPTINSIQNAFNKGTGDVKIVRLNASINALVNAYARAISPTGQVTVSDKDHARDVINSAYSSGQINAILDVMNTEMSFAQQAASETTQLLKDQRESTKGRGDKGQNIPPGYVLHTDAKGNKAYVSPDGKSFIEVK